MAFGEDVRLYYYWDRISCLKGLKAECQQLRRSEKNALHGRLCAGLDIILAVLDT